MFGGGGAVALDIAELGELEPCRVVVRIERELALQRGRVAELAGLLDLVELFRDGGDGRFPGKRFRQTGKRLARLGDLDRKSVV